MSSFVKNTFCNFILILNVRRICKQLCFFSWASGAPCLLALSSWRACRFIDRYFFAESIIYRNLRLRVDRSASLSTPTPPKVSSPARNYARECIRPDEIPAYEAHIPRFFIVQGCTLSCPPAVSRTAMFLVLAFCHFAGYGVAPFDPARQGCA